MGASTGTPNTGTWGIRSLFLIATGIPPNSNVKTYLIPSVVGIKGGAFGEYGLGTYINIKYIF